MAYVFQVGGVRLGGHWRSDGVRDEVFTVHRLSVKHTTRLQVVTLSDRLSHVRSVVEILL